VYAPALVAWVGGPAVVASGNNVGWFPLGPREVFVPAYHASLTYVRNVNITNTRTLSNTYVTNVYQNDTGAQHYMNGTPTAVTAVPRSTFTSGQRVSGQVVPLSSSVLAAAVVVATAPAIVPTRQSVLGAGETRRVARPPSALLQRPVVARSPPPLAPAPFERQLVALRERGGRPLTRSELAALQPATPLAPVKVVASRPPATVPAGAAARSPGATPQAPVTPGLAERARTLQQSILPSAPPRTIPPPRPAPDPSVYAPPAAEPSASAPALRSDRPPTAQQHPTPQRAVAPDDPTPQPAVAPDDPTHAVDRTPAAVPVYHFPSAGDAPARPASAAHSGETNRVPPPPPAPTAATPAPPPPAAHPPPPPPAHTPSSKEEPRDSAAHGDRDSRERAVR
jgi:hypothetical protein